MASFFISSPILMRLTNDLNLPNYLRFLKIPLLFIPTQQRGLFNELQTIALTHEEEQDRADELVDDISCEQLCQKSRAYIPQTPRYTYSIQAALYQNRQRLYNFSTLWLPTLFQSHSAHYACSFDDLVASSPSFINPLFADPRSSAPPSRMHNKDPSFSPHSAAARCGLCPARHPGKLGK
jgi:hypothetical protein